MPRPPDRHGALQPRGPVIVCWAALQGTQASVEPNVKTITFYQRLPVWASDPVVLRGSQRDEASGGHSSAPCDGGAASVLGSAPARVQTHCHILWSCLTFVGTFGWWVSGWVTQQVSFWFKWSSRGFSLFQFKLRVLLIFSGHSLLTINGGRLRIKGQPAA